MDTFQPLKGFRDIYPEEQQARRQVFGKIEEVVHSFGFREIDVPSLESLALFEEKSGEEIVEETFSFEDKGGRRVTMIPEITPTVARMVSARKDLSKPVKWFWNGKCWRYENPQKGRLREFYQLNCDIIGSDAIEADAEILALAATILEELHIADVCTIRLSDRRLLEGVLDAYNVEEKEDVRKLIDKREKIAEEEFRERMEELVGEHAEKIVKVVSHTFPIAEVRNLDELLPETEQIAEVVDELTRLHTMIETYGVADLCVIDLSIVRGLDYYTGLVFEVFDTEGELRSVFGGGRYDALIGELGGPDLPAVGFGMGDAVLEELLRREEKWPHETLQTDVFVADATGEERAFVRDTAQFLREKGFTVEIDVKERGLSKQLERADRVGATLALIVGERDLDKQRLTVKDLRSGNEELIAIEDLEEAIAELL